MSNTENLFSGITVNPRVTVGKPAIRGARIPVEQILRALSGGMSEQELPAGLPGDDNSVSPWTCPFRSFFLPEYPLLFLSMKDQSGGSRP